MKKNMILVIVLIAIITFIIVFFWLRENEVAYLYYGLFPADNQLTEEQLVPFQNTDVYKIIENESEEKTLYINEKININYNENALIYVTRGNRSTGGYDIDIKKIIKGNKKLKIYVKKTNPTNSRTEGFEFFFKLYSIEKKSLIGIDEIEFIEK